MLRAGAPAAAAHRALPPAEASEVSALTQPPLGLDCLWVTPTGPAAPGFLPLHPSPRILKGAARTLPCLLKRWPSKLCG